MEGTEQIRQNSGRSSTPFGVDVFYLCIIHRLHMWLLLIALFTGLAAIFFGILSVRNESKIGIYGIILSVVLIITAFIPFHVIFS